MDSVEALELEPAVPLAKPLVIFAAALVAVALLPQHDASRLVPGLDCALVTEREASQALHADVLLEPSDGHTCRYVSAEFAGDNVALVIVARNGARDALPAHAARSGSEGVAVSRGGRNALLLLEDRRDGADLRAQTERELANLAAPRLDSRR